MATIGPSGAGKSSFIRCINRLVEPSQGWIILDGTEIMDLGSAEMCHMRCQIGMTLISDLATERSLPVANGFPIFCARSLSDHPHIIRAKLP